MSNGNDDWKGTDQTKISTWVLGTQTNLTKRIILNTGQDKRKEGRNDDSDDCTLCYSVVCRGREGLIMSDITITFVTRTGGTSRPGLRLFQWATNVNNNAVIFFSFFIFQFSMWFPSGGNLVGLDWWSRPQLMI